MPPQAYDLWPEQLHSVFRAMNKHNRNGETALLARKCKRVESILRRLEADDPARRLRLQIARSFYELSFYYKDLNQLADARRVLEEARERWKHAVRTSRDDFFARTQLGACHNLIALMADDAGDLDTAEDEFYDALYEREVAHNRNLDNNRKVDDTDCCDNLVYRAGVLCNLGHLYRKQGKGRESSRCYNEAIRELRSLIPRHRKKVDQEICDFFAQQWEMIHGMPHYGRMARQFLENAQWGKAELKASRSQ